MKTFIVALPLFDTEMSVQAYRLCEHNGEKLFGLSHDFQEMGDIWMTPGLRTVSDTGIEPFTGGKPLFADVNKIQLLMGVPLNMKIDPSLLVCVLPATLPGDDLLLREKVDQLRKAGYTLAMAGLSEAAMQGPYFPLVNFVVLSYGRPEFNAQFQLTRHLPRHMRVIFERVPDAESFNRLQRTPQSLLTGEFYSQPLTKGQKKISPVKVNALRLLNEVTAEDFDLTDIARIVERDPAISIALLRFINSPAVGITRRVPSIRNAVAILGQQEIKRWVLVAISIQLAEESPGEITKLSLVRAKFAENLAGHYEQGVLAPSLFMAGLFSLLDVILEMPMEDALSEVMVEDRVRQALLEHAGSLYDVLEMVFAYERGEWDKVSINMVKHNVNPSDITRAFIDALVWYRNLLDEIKEEAEDTQAAQSEE